MTALPSYFTCTLAEALAYNIKHHGVETRSTEYGLVQCHTAFTTVSEYLTFLAKAHPDRTAIGSMSNADLKLEALSFQNLDIVTSQIATWFKNQFDPAIDVDATIAVVASSSLIFVGVWLGLMRAGFKALLIAPQNSSSTVAHLLHVSKAAAICYDDDHSKTAEPAGLEAGVQMAVLPWQDMLQLSTQMSGLEPYKSSVALRHQPLDTAYLFHSSGTTGLPKLIPQSHHGAVGVLPLLQASWASKDELPATLTTTPLYHGGIADLLRAWSAAAPLWIFSEHMGPITGSKVLNYIEALTSASQQNHLKYFSCVPFVLEAISQEPGAFKKLAALDKIGVGGASMPKELGDMLVGQGVRLISRFGSSECGFLLCSDRAFHADPRWDVLRPSRSPDLFQTTDGEYFELVAGLDWPAVTTASYACRPFRTSDLFSKLRDGWKYVGRADAQITLSIGKKVDPQILQDSLKRIELIAEAVVVGDGRSALGALIFVEKSLGDKLSDAQLSKLWAAIRDINSGGPPHTRLRRNMVKFMPHTELKRVEKSSKGTILITHALKEFDAEINQLYVPRIEKLDTTSSKKDVEAAVAALVKLNLSINKEDSITENFSAYGPDSATYMTLRGQLQELISPLNATYSIPLSKLYETDTMSELVDWIYGIKSLDPLDYKAENEEIKRRTQKQIHDFITRYTKNVQPASHPVHVVSKKTKESTVLLTGATGFLGAHILAKLLERPLVRCVYVLIRTPPGVKIEPLKLVKSKLSSSLSRLGLQQLLDDDRLRVVPASIIQDRLGLNNKQFEDICNETTHLIHAAWEVNFNLPLNAFQPQFAALDQLCRVVEHRNSVDETPRRLLFCSSVAACAVPSYIGNSSDTCFLPQTGYGQSKMVAEMMIRKRHIDSAVLRIGQLCGDTVQGIWNSREAWPLLIDAAIVAIPCTSQNGSGELRKAIFPDLAREEQPDIDWTPVDEAAARIVKQTFTHNGQGFNIGLVTNKPSLSWSRFQHLLQRHLLEEYETQVDFIPSMEWLDLLEGTDHPATALAPLWRNNWCSKTSLTKPPVGVECESSKQSELNDQEAEILGEQTVRKVIAWLVRQGMKVHQS